MADFLLPSIGPGKLSLVRTRTARVGMLRLSGVGRTDLDQSQVFGRPGGCAHRGYAALGVRFSRRVAIASGVSMSVRTLSDSMADRFGVSPIGCRRRHRRRGRPSLKRSVSPKVREIMAAGRGAVADHDP